jgi:SAM-dependent methyltransferase
MLERVLKKELVRLKGRNWMERETRSFPTFDYSRLNERLKELDVLYGESGDTQYLMEEDCIFHLLSHSFKIYEKIAEFCLAHDIRRIIDIGCAYGHQSEIFLQAGVDYVGVEMSDDLEFWNRDRFRYIVGKYPCPLQINKGDLAVSVLCLTWGCYFDHGEKTLHEHCEALSRDFQHALLYMPAEHLPVMSLYFHGVMEVDMDGNLFYFYQLK